MAPADSAQIVSAAAAVVTSAVAIVAAKFAYLQIRSNAELARENTALGAHRQLLCLCIERPELSSSTLMLKHLMRSDFQDILNDLNDESERALWFASFVLNTVEQILESNPRDEFWKATMAAQIDYHRELLDEVWPEWREHYGPGMQTFVDHELGLPPPN